jgi:UDP-glucose 4-epimerase
MKNILVTGGFGFIGTTLVELLLQQDSECRVHIVDDLSTSPVSVHDYLDQLKHSTRCTFDIMTVDEYFNGLATERVFDEIYHLASPVGPASVIKQGGKMVGDVVKDIYLIIDYCLEHGTKLLDVSTSEVYGGGDRDGYCSELTPKIFPHNTNMRMEYAIAKLAAETAIVNTCKVANLFAVIIRPFNVAGKRQSIAGGFVVPRFVQQAINSLPYTVFNDGEDIRAFTHVEDIATGMILAMNKGTSGTVYNLGNPDNKIKIKELPDRINFTLDVSNPTAFVNPKILYGAYYENANDKYPDSTRAFDELGWKPSLSIGTIVYDYYTEYQRQVSAGTLVHNILEDYK